MSVTVKVPQDRQPPLLRAAPPLELSAEQLHFRPTLALDFQTTEDLPSRRFNIFVSGLRGTEKLEPLRAWVAQRAVALQMPRDWVYVYNFAQPDAPRAISFLGVRGERHGG